MNLLCSTGAFSRETGFSDHRRLLTFAPQFKVDGFEVLFYPQWYANIEEVIEDFLNAKQFYLTVHSEKSIGPALGSPVIADQKTGLQRLEENCSFAQAIGAGQLVLHLWGMPSSDKNMEINFSLLPQCLDIADHFGVELLVETIPCVKHDPLTHLQRALASDTRCLAALDTEFLAMHNQLGAALEADWLWADGRVQHIHVKDFDGQPMAADGYRRYLQIGEGKIDFLSFFATIKQRNFTGAISLESSGVERDGTVDVEKIEGSLRKLKELMQK